MGGINMVSQTLTKHFKGISWDKKLLDQALAERQRKPDNSGWEDDSACIQRLVSRGLNDPLSRQVLSKLIRLFYANAEKIDFQNVTFSEPETALIEAIHAEVTP